jgi:hypothetical protein
MSMSDACDRAFFDPDVTDGWLENTIGTGAVQHATCEASGLTFSVVGNGGGNSFG